MRMDTRITVVAAAVALLAGGAAISNDRHDDDDVTRLEFRASLSGAQEVTPPAAPATPSPGVQTDATAQIRVRFAKDLSSFRFILPLQNGRQVTQAHLHCGRPGQNGPIIVFLFPLNSGGVDVDGILSDGSRTSADFVASAANCETAIGRPIRDIASLAFAARDGLIYANIHSLTNPAGEVRGALLPVDD
jgi:CHRD domain